MEHPAVGARILRTIPFLLPHVDIVELHHERPDGLGYPNGLARRRHPAAGAHRPCRRRLRRHHDERAYRDGRSSDDALRELWRCAGTEYHADIVGALARALPRVAAARRRSGRRLRLSSSRGTSEVAQCVGSSLAGRRPGGRCVRRRCWRTHRPLVHAQTLSRVSLDSVGAIDLFGGQGTTGNPDASVDISSVIRLANGWSAHVRPWFFKSSSNGSTWSRELYQAAVHYERPGATSLRVDTGFHRVADRSRHARDARRHQPDDSAAPQLLHAAAALRSRRTGRRADYRFLPVRRNVTASTSRWDCAGPLWPPRPRAVTPSTAQGRTLTATPVAISGGGVSAASGSPHRRVVRGRPVRDAR